MPKQQRIVVVTVPGRPVPKGRHGVYVSRRGGRQGPITDLANISRIRYNRYMDTQWPIAVTLESIIIEAFFEGEPIPHERPRVGRNGTTYTPERTAVYKEAIAWQIRALAMNHTDKPETRYGIQALFARSTRHRVDVDNLLKTVLDATTRSGLWKDDSQVLEIAARLALAQDVPGVHVLIYHVPPNLTVAKRYEPPLCATCGKPILRTRPSTSHLYKFCSKTCFATSSRLTLECSNCHKPFDILRCQVRNPGNKKDGSASYLRQFCSRPCSIEFHQRKSRIDGKESDKWICTKCGGRVSRKEYLLCRGCSMTTRSDPTTNYWNLRHGKALETKP